METSIIWNGIQIDIAYNPERHALYREIYGYSLAHLQIRTARKEKLPITETGYLSHFTRADEIEDKGGPAAFVRAWLDHEAQAPAWKNSQVKAAQLSLF
jgi:hypothetical protein